MEDSSKNCSQSSTVSNSISTWTTKNIIKVLNINNSSIFDHTLLSLQISYRHYLHGSLLEDMIQENMSKFIERMAKETGPFEPKQYISLMVFHQLYTVCFGERCVFNLYSVIIINLQFKPKWKSIFETWEFLSYFCPNLFYDLKW